MKRIVNHWTAGTGRVSSRDKKHYHFIIDSAGRVHEGNFKPEDNESTKTPYAAHTRGLNTGSIGVAVAAMHGAKEYPFKTGKHPITERQVEVLAKINAKLCQEYDIPVRPDTVLTHAEVQPNLGVKQRGKWDINWLPGMDKPKAPEVAGEIIRAKTRGYFPKTAQPDFPPSPFAALGKALALLFTKAKEKR